MNIPPVIAHQVCPHCGAFSQDKKGRCWLCLEAKPEENPFAAPMTQISFSEAGQRFTTWDSIASVLLVLCVFLTILVGVGFAVQDRGMLIPFAICVVPPYLVTLIRGLYGFGTPNRSKPGTLFLTLVVSALVTGLVLFLLIVGAVVVLFLICLYEVNRR